MEGNFIATWGHWQVTGASCHAPSPTNERKVSTLAGSVLLALSEDQRSRCNREAIVTALNNLTGSDPVQDLRDMIEEDPDSVKARLAAPGRHPALSLLCQAQAGAEGAMASQPAVVGDGWRSRRRLPAGAQPWRGCGGCARR